MLKTLNISNNGLYQRFTPSGYKDIGISKFEFVAKTEFLLKIKIGKCKGKQYGRRASRNQRIIFTNIFKLLDESTDLQKPDQT